MKISIILFLMSLICWSSWASSSSSSSSSGSSSSSSSSSSESSSHESSHHSHKVKCPYTLWIGDEVDREYSIELKCKPGIPFIDVMNQAAAKSSRFKFEQKAHPTYGPFITEICGVPNSNKTGQYWILYDLTSKPDVYDRPCGKSQSPIGVSELKVVKYHYYLFWYQTAEATEGQGQCA